ncbi:MAG: hypothetical protein ACI80K_001209, partial [Paracoccaceae bacterium]
AAHLSPGLDFPSGLYFLAADEEEAASVEPVEETKPESDE